MLGAAAVSDPFKLVLAIDFHVGNNHGQHLFMYVNPRDPIRHNVPPGGSGERAANSLTRVTGYRHFHRTEETTPNHLLNHPPSRSHTSPLPTPPSPTQP